MYERFTDRARKAMQLANEEAKRFNHEYIGTEHILLGLLAEGRGVAANVLMNLGINLEELRLGLEKQLPSLPDAVHAKLPQSPRAKFVIECAMEESRGLNHNYVGTEHLLLGLLREDQGIAARVLTALGVTLENVRRGTLDLLGSGPPAPRRSEELVAKFKQHPQVRAYLDEIRELHERKEAAVANCEFEAAAKYRDQADEVRHKLQAFYEQLLEDEGDESSDP